MFVALGGARITTKRTPTFRAACHATRPAASHSGTQPSTHGGFSDTLSYQDAGVDISLSVQSMTQRVLLRTIPRQALTRSAAKLVSRAKGQQRRSALPLLQDAAAQSTEASVAARRLAVAQLQACTDLLQLHQQLHQLVPQLDGSGLSAAAACVVKLLQQARRQWQQPGGAPQGAVPPSQEQQQVQEGGSAAVDGARHPSSWAGEQRQEAAAGQSAEQTQQQSDNTSSSSSSSSGGGGGSASSSGAGAGASREAQAVGSGLAGEEEEEEAILEARRRSHSVASTSGPAGMQGSGAGSRSEEKAKVAARLAAECIAERAASLHYSINAQQASTIIYCMAQAGHHSHERVQQLLAGHRMLEELGGLSAPEHFRLIWGLAVLDAKLPQEWLEEWCKASQSRFHQAQPLHLATYAWALARLRHAPSDLWLHCLMEATEPLLPHLVPQLLSNLVWGLGRLSAQPTAEWADQCMAVARQLLQGDQHETRCSVSMLLYGMVLLRMQLPPSFLEACLEGVEARLPRHTALDDCNLVWALAAWRHRPPPAFMQAFTTHSQRRLRTATATDLALTAWALAALSYRPPRPWLTHFYSRSLATLPQHHPPDLIATLLATHRWGVAPDPNYTAHLLARAQESFRHFTLRNHVALLWCLVQLRVEAPAAWLVVHLRHVQNHLAALDPQAASVLLYCTAVLAPGEKVERRQFVHDTKRDLWRLLQRTHELLARAGPQELYAYIVALMRLQVNPGIKYLRSHVKAVRAQGAAYSREQVVAMRAAYHQLGRKPPLLPQVDRLR